MSDVCFLATPIFYALQLDDIALNILNMSIISISEKLFLTS